MNLPLLADRCHCSGCGACANVCPKNAISMKPDQEGFLQPCVDQEKCISCGKCTRTCPVLNLEKTNEKPENVYAVRASDEIRQRSSSGGVFTLAAEWILKQGGVVCGAAFDENMQLRHIMIDRVEDLDLLRGSKYLQSDVKDIYSQVRKSLKDGRKVLFTGTPCQVAALYSVAGKHDNLYSIDILCHGVPSQTVFNKYLEEIANGREVKSVRFRDKRFGWVANHIIVEFEDGSTHIGTDKTDAYEKGFLRNLFLRPSCEDCRFSVFPRHGDISLGDFWGIQKTDATQNDGKGTSILLINNERGRMIFEKISDSTQYKTETIDYETIPNRVRAGCVYSKGRNRFFQLLAQGKSLITSVDNALNKTGYDVGLVSNYCAENFGGILTHYALYHTLQDMGYSTLMITHPLVPKNPHQELPAALRRCCLTDIYPDYDRARFYHYRHEMRELNNICDSFVVGSDQLFQYGLYTGLDQFVSLDWVESRKKKIAVAASFGHRGIWGNPKIHAEMAYWLSRYDHFSVREDDAVALCRETYGVDVEQVLDPVFLVDVRHYDELIARADRELPQNYVGFYILDPDEAKGTIISDAAQYYDVSMTGFSEFNRIGEYTTPIAMCNPENYMTEERLKVIKNAKCMVTDSFHGTCLSIIMHRPFIAYLNASRGASRFYSILKLVGLENRLVTSYEEYMQKRDVLLNTPIDWDEVDRRLAIEKARTMQWLRNALCASKLNRNEVYDVLTYRLADINRGLVERQSKFERDIEEFKNQKAELEKRIAILEDRLAMRNSNIQEKADSLIKKGIRFYKQNGFSCTVKRVWQKVTTRK